MGVIPWYNMTLPRVDMHEGPFCAFQVHAEQPGGFCCDCTHYCYTPQMWHHFFSGVHDAIEAVELKRAAAAAAA